MMRWRSGNVSSGRPRFGASCSNRPYLAKIIGIPGVSIKGAFVELPGGVILELLDYEAPDKRSNSEATANPGNIHLCLAVEDALASRGSTLSIAAQSR